MFSYYQYKISFKFYCAYVVNLILQQLLYFFN